jgi:hypothetical protein
MRDLIENSMGQSGFDFINDTAAHACASGYVYDAVQMVTDTVLAAYSTEPTIGGNTFTAVSIPQGTIIYGRFTSLTLTSGSCIAYKGI